MQLRQLDLLITAADVSIAAGGFECWAIVKSINFNEAYQACIVVGSRIGDGALNLLNLIGAKVEHAGSGGTVVSTLDHIKDDVPHLIGVQFYPGVRPKLFVDGALIADDNPADPNFLPTFSAGGEAEGYTGWQSIFAGNSGGNDGNGTATLAMGGLVIRKGATAAWDAATIAKLMSWARDWGVK